MNPFDTPEALVSSIFVAAITLFIYVHAFFLGKFKDSHDVLAGLMLHWAEKKKGPIWLWFWIWVGLSLGLGVVSPGIFSNGFGKWLDNLYGLSITLIYILIVLCPLYTYPKLSKKYRPFIWIWVGLSLGLGVVLTGIFGTDFRKWLGTRYGFLITLNYTFVVPLLLWAYLELLREVRHFFRPKNQTDLALDFNERLKECWLFQPVWHNTVSNVALFFVACSATGVAVDEVIAPIVSAKECPTLWATKISCSFRGSLNLAGYLYYSIVRGLDTYLAGGLTFLVFGLLYVFYFGIDYKKIDKFLVGEPANLNLKPSIRQLIKKLSYCLFLGPLVVAIHGWALFWNNNPRSAVWLAWTVVVSFGTLCLLYGIWRFNLSVKETVMEKMRKDVEQFFDKEQKPSLNSYNAKIESLVTINTYVRRGSKVSDVGISQLVVAFSFLVQLLGFSGQILGNESNADKSKSSVEQSSENRLNSQENNNLSIAEKGH